MNEGGGGGGGGSLNTYDQRNWGHVGVLLVKKGRADILDSRWPIFLASPITTTTNTK